MFSSESYICILCLPGYIKFVFARRTDQIHFLFLLTFAGQTAGRVRTLPFMSFAFIQNQIDKNSSEIKVFRVTHLILLIKEPAGALTFLKETGRSLLTRSHCSDSLMAGGDISIVYLLYIYSIYSIYAIIRCVSCSFRIESLLNSMDCAHNCHFVVICDTKLV